MTRQWKNTVLVIRGIAFSPRFFLWCALLVPTLLALSQSDGFGRGGAGLLWALCASSLFAALPRRAFGLTQWVVVIAIPGILWWTGYATLNGIGPGWEAAIAAVSTNADEILSAAKLVVRVPTFGIAVAIFSALLGASIYLRKLSETETLVTMRQLVLAGSLSVFAMSAVTSAANLPIDNLFQNSDRDFSPIGTAVNISMRAIDRALYGDLLDTDGNRDAGYAPQKVSEPILGIFVIGESMRDGGIGPRHRQRDPWTLALDDRVKNNLGTWLPPTCAGSHGTHISVPLLITGSLPHKYSESKTAPSVLAVLKNAGYKTAWLTNQDTSVFQESGHDEYWSRGTATNGAFDESLISIAEIFFDPLVRAKSSTPRAAVMHTMGNHFEYEDRYPSSGFPPEPNNLSADQLRELRYDRSLQYTAKFLVRLLKILDRSKVPAFLVYSSDHGENLPSDKNGLQAHLGPRASIHDGTTASFVFWNEEMRSRSSVELLKPLQQAEMVAHADIAKVFLTLGAVNNEMVEPNRMPTILAPVSAGQPFRVNACNLLKP